MACSLVMGRGGLASSRLMTWGGPQWPAGNGTMRPEEDGSAQTDPQAPAPILRRGEGRVVMISMVEDGAMSGGYQWRWT